MTVSPRKRALIFLSQSESLTPRGRRLIDEKLGGPENALEGFSYDIRRLIGDKAYRELAAVRDRGVDALIEAMEKAGVRAVSMEDDDYPEKLRVIPDAPGAALYPRDDPGGAGPLGRRVPPQYPLRAGQRPAPVPGHRLLRGADRQRPGPGHRYRRPRGSAFGQREDRRGHGLRAGPDLSPGK